MDKNFIIHQRAKRYEWVGDCYLSIKSFRGGNARYQVGRREYLMDQNNYLVLNECTRYRLHIDGNDETESFCVFFSPCFVQTTISDLRATDRELLDLDSSGCEGLSLVERLYTCQGPVAQLLCHGRDSWEGMMSLQRDEFLQNLIVAIVWQNGESCMESDRLPAKKKSTRDEIYRRILYVRDYIESAYFKELHLSDLAEVAMLSENHLLRNFKKIFQLSPFQYISKKRIAVAKTKLLTSDQAIKDIAMEVGYASMSNFSTYFKAITGKTPGDFRKGDM